MSWCWFLIPSTFLPFLDLFLLSGFRLHLELITTVLPLYNQIMGVPLPKYPLLLGWCKSNCRFELLKFAV